MSRPTQPPRGTAAALALVAAAAVAAVSTTSSAGTTVLRSDLSTLNGSGVTGTAELTFDDVAETLEVQITASGLEPGQVHPQHIHGFLDDTDARVPTLEQDDDGDGFIELLEGLETYGPILLELTPFPTAADGTINYRRTFTNADIDELSPAEGVDSIDDLTPLQLREIVLHGLTVDDTVGAGTAGEVDGTAGYKAVLPVASGEIAVIPLPPGAWAGLATLGGMGGFSWLRGRFRLRRRG